MFSDECIHHNKEIEVKLNLSTFLLTAIASIVGSQVARADSAVADIPLGDPSTLHRLTSDSTYLEENVSWNDSLEGLLTETKVWQLAPGAMSWTVLRDFKLGASYFSPYYQEVNLTTSPTTPKGTWYFKYENL